jgi:hypothetical protein
MHRVWKPGAAAREKTRFKDESFIPQALAPWLAAFLLHAERTTCMMATPSLSLRVALMCLWLSIGCALMAQVTLPPSGDNQTSIVTQYMGLVSSIAQLKEGKDVN